MVVFFTLVRLVSQAHNTEENFPNMFFSFTDGIYYVWLVQGFELWGHNLGLCCVIMVSFVTPKVGCY